MSLHRFNTAASAIQAVVDRIVAQSPHAVGLTGGRAGAQITEQLVSRWPDGEPLVMWHTDERFLPLGDDDRNDTVALAAVEERDDTLIRVESVLGPDAGVDVSASAADYAARLDRAGVPQMAVLSVGPDGHVASLFPGHRLSTATAATVAPIEDSPKPPASRVTWTLPLLLRCPTLLLVAVGTDKADAVSRVIAGDDSLPATAVYSAGAELYVCTT